MSNILKGLKKVDGKKTGIFAAGVAFGTAGIKILTSKDAKKLYTNCTAAVLRAKACVMKTASAIQENAEDIYAEAQQINEDRAAAEEVVEDTADEAAEETEEYKWQENQSEGIQTDCHDEDKLCAVLYYEPICEENILDDFVWIESKKELQLLLERTEEKPLYTLKVSVLLMEMVKDKPKYREVVYRRNTENRWNRDV